jgi:arsenate reductase
MSLFYYLATCDTCQRIMNNLNLPESIQKREIKSKPISEVELRSLRELSGSYEALFSKRARLYKERNLKEANLREEDFKELLLEHYTFLKRPVLVYRDAIFIGNSKKTVEAAYSALHHS